MMGSRSGSAIAAQVGRFASEIEKARWQGDFRRRKTSRHLLDESALSRLSRDRIVSARNPLDGSKLLPEEEDARRRRPHHAARVQRQAVRRVVDRRASGSQRARGPLTRATRTRQTLSEAAVRISDSRRFSFNRSRNLRARRAGVAAAGAAGKLAAGSAETLPGELETMCGITVGTVSSGAGIEPSHPHDSSCA